MKLEVRELAMLAFDRTRDALRDSGNWLSREWPWLIVSLALAILVFWRVRDEISHENTFEIPVNVELPNSDSGLAATVDPPKVSVTLRGTESDIEKLGDGKNLKLAITVRNPERLAASKAVRVKLAPGLIGRMFAGNHEGVSCRFSGEGNARLVKFDNGIDKKDGDNHDTVDLSFDEKASFEFAVETPATTGTPAAGRPIVSLKNNKVMLTGSKSKLEGLRAIKLKTAPIDLEGRAWTIDTKVKVIPPADYHDVVIDPEIVEAMVVFESTDVSRPISNVVVRVTQETGGLDATWLSSPSNVVVTLTGPSNVVYGVSEKRILVVAHAEDGERLDSVKLFAKPIDADNVKVSLSPAFVKLSRIALAEPVRTDAEAPAESGAPEEPVEPGRQQESETK